VATAAMIPGPGCSVEARAIIMWMPVVQVVFEEEVMLVWWVQRGVEMARERKVVKRRAVGRRVERMVFIRRERGNECISKWSVGHVSTT